MWAFTMSVLRFVAFRIPAERISFAYLLSCSLLDEGCGVT
jgi:hypothetical protein